MTKVPSSPRRMYSSSSFFSMTSAFLTFVMADKKKLPALMVEYKISMHCKACEKEVANVITKFKGVHTFSTEMVNHRVIVKGRFIPEKLLKKLEKKMGKKVAIVVPKEAPKPTVEPEEKPKNPIPVQFDDWGMSEVLTMFSDENPNACSIM